MFSHKFCIDFMSHQNIALHPTSRNTDLKSDGQAYWLRALFPAGSWRAIVTCGASYRARAFSCPFFSRPFFTAVKRQTRFSSMVAATTFIALYHMNFFGIRGLLLSLPAILNKPSPTTVCPFVVQYKRHVLKVLHPYLPGVKCRS